MAMDPERPIEKLLRDRARERAGQAGGAFEMHPATRRLLQGEVARQFPRAAANGSWLSKLFLNSGPKLAWGAALASVLVVIGALLVSPLTHRQGERTFAQVAGVERETGEKESSSPMD